MVVGTAERPNGKPLLVPRLQKIFLCPNFGLTIRYARRGPRKILEPINRPEESYVDVSRISGKGWQSLKSHQLVRKVVVSMS